MITWEQMVAGVSFIGCLIAIFKAVSDSRRAARKETEDKAAERQGVQSKLESILERLKEIRDEQSKQRDENQKLRECIADAKALAQKALDRIEAHERRGDA
jgi:chromosome segregation ATPase